MTGRFVSDVCSHLVRALCSRCPAHLVETPSGQVFGAGRQLRARVARQQVGVAEVRVAVQQGRGLAREQGLHTAPQGWWRNWSSVCHEILDIEDGQHVFVGLALGHANPDAPVNSLYSDRAPLSDLVKFYD